jgi:large subunit ribosomal protein L18e
MKLTKTNPKLVELIGTLKEKSYQEDVAIWKDVAKRLERSNRRKAEVNISQINRHSSPDETVLVPGKILGSGELNHKVNVIALNFSKRAEEKIAAAGGECLDISEILDKNPKGNKIRIIE